MKINRAAGLTASSIATLTNKTIDGDDNTLLDIALASIKAQTQGDVFYAAAAGVVTRLPASTAGRVLKTGGAAANPSFADPNVTLLAAGSGTDTTEAEHTLATVAISGLDAKDSLLVIVTVSQITQAGTRILLRNDTDGVNFGTNTPGATIGAGSFVCGQFLVKQSQEGNTSIITHSIGDGSAEVATHAVSQHTATTPWTSAWTLAIRSLGQTAGGTERFTYKVYRLRGTQP